MIIVITGTPGTGKSRAAELIAKHLGMHMVDVNKIVKRMRLNKEDDCIVVDPAKLRAKLKKQKDCIIESHLLCEMALPAEFVFVFRCEPEVLRQRLMNRKWQQKKVLENLECEAIDYCLQRALENYDKKLVFEVDTSKLDERVVALKVVRAVKWKRDKDKLKVGQISWADWLSKHAEELIRAGC